MVFIRSISFNLSYLKKLHQNAFRLKTSYVKLHCFHPVSFWRFPFKEIGSASHLETSFFSQSERASCKFDLGMGGRLMI